MEEREDIIAEIIRLLWEAAPNILELIYYLLK
jgi:hypothetical protein